MSSILERTVGTETDKRLVLTNEQCGRVMSVGSDWTTLRIGIRWYTTRVTAYTSAPALFFGICSGTTNKYGDATTTNFLGMRTNTGNFSTYSTGGVNFLNTTYPNVVKKVNTTITQLTKQTGSLSVIGASDVRRFAIFMQIVKGSPNYTVNVWGTRSTNRIDVDYVTFYDMMIAGAALPIAPLSALVNSTDVAVDEVAGVFDTINAGWLAPSDSLEISDIAYIKIN